MARTSRVFFNLFIFFFPLLLSSSSSLASSLASSPAAPPAPFPRRAGGRSRRRAAARMPQLPGAGGGGGDPELCATDEMIPFKDEGDPQKEKIFAEISHPEEEGDLADIKSSLVNESEIAPGAEVRGWGATRSGERRPSPAVVAWPRQRPPRPGRARRGAGPVGAGGGPSAAPHADGPWALGGVHTELSGRNARH